jgi:hypothetical protein
MLITYQNSVFVDLLYIKLKMHIIEMRKTPMCIYINAYRATHGPSLNYFTKNNITYNIHRAYLSCSGHAVEYRPHSVPYLHALGFMHFNVHHILQSLRIRVCINCFSLYVSQSTLGAAFYTNDGVRYVL